MLKENKWKVIISSIIILLPVLAGIILWDRLPERMAVHWGADGNTDGFAMKAVSVFVPPVFLLAVHLICLCVTSLDKKQKDQNKKALGMIFWIVPFTSLVAGGLKYSIALGRDIKALSFGQILLGVMFILIGNYLPKIKQNRTLGIKISWTLKNEENWNLTHRFGGKIWVMGGAVLLISGFLSGKFMIPVSLCAIIAMIIIPVIYSYCIYRRHQKEGVSYDSILTEKTDIIIAVAVIIFMSIIFIMSAVLMFTGDIEISCGDNSLKIEADYWADLEVDYSKIDSVEYRENFDSGSRTNGFGTARLRMGTFENDEFGRYTMYAYTANNSCIVLKSDGEILVISARNDSDTKELYETLSAIIF